MLKRLRGFDFYCPDNGVLALLGETVTGDVFQKMQGAVMEEFLMPDSNGNVRGLPADFFMLAELVTSQSGIGQGGGSTRRAAIMATQETTVYRIYATRFARAFFQGKGFFDHLPIIEADPLIDVSACVKEKGDGE